LPSHIFLIDEPHESLIHECRGLQCMPRRFLFHVVMGQPMQFLINNGHQLVPRNLITFAPGNEQLGNLRRWGCGVLHRHRERL